MEKEISDACVPQWLEESTGNRKTWARIPVQSKASFFFHRKIVKFFKYYPMILILFKNQKVYGSLKFE